jgi:hypothetical protein
MIAPAILDIGRTRAWRGHRDPNQDGHGDADDAACMTDLS